MNDARTADGGELLELWRDATTDRPTIQAVFADAAALGYEAGGELGHCRPAWAQLARLYEQATVTATGSTPAR